MSNPFNEAHFVADVSKAVMSAPMACFAEAWGFGDKSNQHGSKQADSTIPNPLSAGMSVLFKMSMGAMQHELDEALKKSIY